MLDTKKFKGLIDSFHEQILKTHVEITKKN